MRTKSLWMWNREDQNTNKQSNDPSPEFTGTKPSEFKSYREKVRRWLLFTRTPAQLQGPRVLSRLTCPAWDACDGLKPEDVAVTDGVNMILDTSAEAFQDEHATELFDALEDTFYGPGRKKGERLHDYALRVQNNVRELAKQGGAAAGPNTGFPSAASIEHEHPSAHCHHDPGRQQLVTWRCEERRASDTLMIFCEIRRNTTCSDRTQSVSHRQEKHLLSQRNKKETPSWKLRWRPSHRNATLIWKKPKSRRYCWPTKNRDSYRREQRVNRGFRPVTGRTSGGKPYRVEGRLNIKELISRTRCRLCRREGTLGT